jgi:uncharacterized protein YbaR (Trm112 family)
MKNKKFLTQSDRKNIISEREKTILESFANTFNKIKRIDENEVLENYNNNVSENDNQSLVDARTSLAYKIVQKIGNILKDEMVREPDEYGMTTPELVKTFLYNFDAVDNGEGKIIGFRKGDLTSFVKRAKNYLSNNDLIYVNDNGVVDINNSNSPEIAKLFMKLESL